MVYTQSHCTAPTGNHSTHDFSAVYLSAGCLGSASGSCGHETPDFLAGPHLRKSNTSQRVWETWLYECRKEQSKSLLESKEVPNLEQLSSYWCFERTLSAITVVRSRQTLILCVYASQVRNLNMQKPLEGEGRGKSPTKRSSCSFHTGGE